MFPRNRDRIRIISGRAANEDVELWIRREDAPLLAKPWVD
jgi:hypothetical protein